MKPLTRRSVTTGLAAAVTAIPAVGLCEGVSQELRQLIEAHRVAWAAFEVEVDYHIEHNETRDSYHDAFDAQEELFLQICSYRCTALEEQRMRAKYLLTCPTVRDFWDLSDAPGALQFLRSIAA